MSSGEDKQMLSSAYRCCTTFYLGSQREDRRPLSPFSSHSFCYADQIKSLLDQLCVV